MLNSQRVERSQGSHMQVARPCHLHYQPQPATCFLFLCTPCFHSLSLYTACSLFLFLCTTCFHSLFLCTPCCFAACHCRTITNQS